MRVPSVRVLSDIAFEEGREFDPSDIPPPAVVERWYWADHPAPLHELLEQMSRTDPEPAPGAEQHWPAFS